MRALLQIVAISGLTCLGLTGCGSGLLPGTTASTAAPLKITAVLSPAVDGIAYSSALQASGGSSHYTWSLMQGAMPEGLQLEPTTGVISGTPAKPGTSNVVIGVSDDSESSSTALALTVLPRLTLSANAVPSAQIGVSYSDVLTVAGGQAPYSWSIQGGTLPNGMTMANGVFGGAPIQVGTYSFTLAVVDSGSPTATVSVPLSITVNGPLAILGNTLPAGATQNAYSATLTAAGGTPSYAWSLVNGALPSGLALAASGAITGTPLKTGTSSFTVAVSDQSAPVQAVQATYTIGVAASPLVLTAPSLASGIAGVGYSASFQVSGGTPAYQWTVVSGALPAGLLLNSSTGVLSGTPTTAGTFNLTVAVSDAGSPVQTQTASAAITVAPASGGNTWYVRPDGGTRYSAHASAGQCDGLSDSAYSGQGTNQHCAFNDVRSFWTDGTYCTDYSSTSTCWLWVGKGGDTYLIRGSIAGGVSYRIGQNGPNSSDYFGLAGNPFGAGAPVPPSGTANAHTRILGGNYGSCTAASARTQLHGGYGVNSVLNMSGASYVDVACLDITDFSSCGRMGQKNGCNTNFPLSDYATVGITWNNKSTNDTLTDVSTHGLAAFGLFGSTGDGVVMTDISIVGNAGGGWNADAGDGTTGVGSLLVQNYTISWNGCTEEYPMVDGLPYQDCTDDNGGGYGDGFGTATALSPGWQVHFDQGVVSYNTQDGLDALHLIGANSSMTVTRTLAYGNMGQQLKVGGAAGSIINNVIMTNCNALRQAIPGTPAGYNSQLSDFCRAADGGIAMTGGANSMTKFDFNTVYSASSTGIEIECDTTNGPCNKTTLIDYRNNIFVGFLNNQADGYPSGGTGDYSNPIYIGAGTNLLTNPGSLVSNNVTYHPKSTWSCPTSGESNALCLDPQLTDETWHVYGYADVAPNPAVRIVQGSGVAIAGISEDFTGQPRGVSPSIGAYQ